MDIIAGCMFFIARCMFLFPMHPVGAQNNSLISNTVLIHCECSKMVIIY